MEFNEEYEKVTGIYQPTGEEKSFKYVWGGERFTDEEIEKLFAGEEIEVERVSQKGNKYSMIGKLEEGEYNGKPTFSFQKVSFGVPYAWGGKDFTDEERASLKSGETITVQRTSKKGSDYTVNLTFTDGEIKADFDN